MCLVCFTQDVIPTWLLFLNQFTNFFSVLLIVGGE